MCGRPATEVSDWRRQRGVGQSEGKSKNARAPILKNYVTCASKNLIGACIPLHFLLCVGRLGGGTLATEGDEHLINRFSSTLIATCLLFFSFALIYTQSSPPGAYLSAITDPCLSSSLGKCFWQIVLLVGDYISLCFSAWESIWELLLVSDYVALLSSAWGKCSLG